MDDIVRRINDMTLDIRIMRCVYVVHALGTKYYKIGKSANIKNRLRGLQVSSPTKIKLIAIHYFGDYSNLETSLHKKFQHVRRETSEWFELSIKDIEFLLLETNEILSNLQLPTRAPLPAPNQAKAKSHIQILPSPYSVINLTPRSLEQEASPEIEVIKDIEVAKEKEEPLPRLIRVAKGEEIAIADQPTIDDEFQYGLLPEIWELYEELGTWEAVGKHYGIPKGKIWYIANNKVMPYQNKLREKLGLCTIYSVQDYIPEGIL